MPTSNRPILISLALIAIGVSIAWIWILFIGSNQLFSNLSQVKPVYLIPMLFITGMFVFMRFIRWQFLLRRISIRIPTRPSFSLYLASLVGTATPLYLGEAALRSYFLKKRFAVPVRVTLIIFILERLLDVLTVSLLCLVTSNSWAVSSLTLLFISGTILGFILTSRIGSKLGIHVYEITRPDILFQSILLSLVIWIPAAFLINIASTSINIGLSPLVGINTFSFSTLLGAMTIMPAGIGTTGSFAILQLMDNDIMSSQAVTIVTLVRLTSTFVIIALGTFFLIYEWKATKNIALSEKEHFDEIASEYKVQFQEHVWDYLLDKKVNLITKYLPDPSKHNILGLDLGCGLGQQSIKLQNLGYPLIGLDLSFQLLRHAHTSGLSVVNGSALQLPFPDNSLDFVYMVGILHHVPGSDLQLQACNEVRRVLKPGGVFVIHESNPRNPLFRFYMGYIFPLLKTIDEGIERWINPKQWEHIEGMKLEDTVYFTFIPDFIPKFLMPPLRKMEKWLEAGSMRSYSVHYMAVLKKV